MRRRCAAAAVWASAALLLLAGRLVDLQVAQGPSLSAAATQQRMRVTPLLASRGDIVDRNGDILAVSEPASLVWADQAQVADRRRTAGDLASILGLNAAGLERALARSGQYVVLDPAATTAQGAAVSALGLAGIYTSPTTVRDYPKGFFLGGVLGFVGASGQGLAGVEYSYQNALAGRNGFIREQVGLGGQPLPGTHSVVRPAVPGLTLQLTIDDGIQRDLEEQLEAQVAATRAQAAYGIVMRPSDGQILAAASWPTFDPNHYGDVPPSVWDNTVVGTELVPGSVFKTVVAAAALQSGVVSPTTPFYDPGYIRVDGVALHNFTTLETQTDFARALEESANVVFAHVGLTLGVPRFYSYLRAFGLLGPTGVDLPGEQIDQFTPERQVTPLTLAEESFGESIAVTPLSLIDAAAAVANGGLLVRPHVGLALLNASGRRVRTIPTTVIRRVISPSVAALERQLLVGVVNNGTGERGFIPCYDAAGKTGTANIYGNGGVLNQFIASFIMFAPADHPAAIVLVMLVNPQGNFNEGGEVAAPVAQAVLLDALHRLGVPPHCTSTDMSTPTPGSQGTTALTLDMVSMPSIVGMSPNAARSTAQAAGLVLQVGGAGSRILTQSPPAGASVQKWTTVNGYTNAFALLPASFVHVPSVLGDSVGRASSVLAQSRLALDVSGVGAAIAQYPAPGALAPPGSGVQVTFAAMAAKAKG